MGTGVSNVVDAFGAKLPDVSVDLQDNFRVDDPVGKGLLGEPDEDHSGYTGNEGATIDRVRLHVRWLDRSIEAAAMLVLVHFSSHSTNHPDPQTYQRCCFIMWPASAHLDKMVRYVSWVVLVPGWMSIHMCKGP